MMRTETLALTVAPATVASGVRGFSVDQKGGAAGPYLARLRYEGDGKDSDLVVQVGRWYAHGRIIERLQLASPLGAADVYLTTGTHPRDTVVA